MVSRIAERLRAVVQTWDAGEPERAFDLLFDPATNGLGDNLGVLSSTNLELILELRCANPRSAEWRETLEILLRLVESELPASEAAIAG